MHICHLNMPIEYYSPTSGGAVATVIMNQVKELEARGHQVTVITPVDEGPTYAAGRVVGIRGFGRHELSFLQRRLSDLKRRLFAWDWVYYDYYLRAFRRVFAELAPPPEVVVVHNDLVSAHYLRSLLPKCRILCWLHNEQSTGQRQLEVRLGAVDTFVCVSEHVAEWTRNRYRLPRERVKVVLNGVDPVLFHPAPGYLEPAAPLRVLFVGRLNHVKGPDVAAEAVSLLRAEGVPVSLAVAGAQWWYGNANQERDPYIRSLLQKLEGMDARYYGHVPPAQMPAVYREHDVICVPSRWSEPFGLVALEGMACGCAAVVAARGGLPEACGSAGILVDPADTSTLVRALRDLATNPARLAEYKQRAVAHARAASWSHRVERLEQLLLHANLMVPPRSLEALSP